MNAQLNSLQFVSSLNFLVNTINTTDSQQINDNFDLSKPSKSEAEQALQIYQQLQFLQPHKNFLALFVKNEAIDFLDKTFFYLNNIKTELQNVAGGTATEDDFDELAWQTSFKNTPDKVFQNFHNEIDQAIKQNMFEEGGFDNL